MVELVSTPINYQAGDAALVNRGGQPAMIPLSSVASSGNYNDLTNTPFVRYDSVSDLLASNEVSRGVGKIWEAADFRYQEVASGQHVTTAGGVKLAVLPNSDGSVTPQQFGAVSFVAAQDAGIDACLTYAAAQGLTARFTAGEWIKSTPLVLTVTGDKGLTIEGEGDGSTIIRLNTGGNGIEINLTGNWWLHGQSGSTALRVQDVCFSTTNVNVGVGVKVVGQSLAGRPGPSVRFTRCMWRAHSGFSQFWARGLEVINCQSTWYDLCRFECGGPGNVTANGVFVGGTLLSNSPTLHQFTNCIFTYGNRSFEGGNFIEGVYFSNCTFVASNVGVYWQPSQAESGLVIDGGHMNTIQRWVDLNNVVDFEIYGGHYFRNLAEDATFRGIKIANGGRGKINDNVFIGRNLADGADIAIEITSLINAEEWGLSIDDNTFHKWQTRAIWATSNSNYLKVGAGNNYRACAERVLNQSSNNSTFLQPKVWCATVARTLTGGAATENSDITIPTGVFRTTPTAVVSVDAVSALSVNVFFDWSASSPTNARIVFRNPAGGNVPAGTFRVHITLSENVNSNLI